MAPVESRDLRLFSFSYQYLFVACRFSVFICYREDIKLWESNPWWILRTYSIFLSQTVLRRGHLAQPSWHARMVKSCGQPSRVELLGQRGGPSGSGAGVCLYLLFWYCRCSYSLPVIQVKVELHCSVCISACHLGATFLDNRKCHKIVPFVSEDKFLQCCLIVRLCFIQMKAEGEWFQELFQWSPRMALTQRAAWCGPGAFGALLSAGVVQQEAFLLHLSMRNPRLRDSQVSGNADTYSCFFF